jgi:hypothetical protein
MDRNIEKKFIKENEKDENVLHEATRCKKPKLTQHYGITELEKKINT